MKTLKLFFVTLLVMVLILPTSVFAKDTGKAGKMTAVTGKAEVKKGGGFKKFNAFKGMAITQGDTIMTGSDGKVKMDLDSDKEVTIGTNTTLVVSELVKSAKALGGKTSLSLLKGKVLVSIKKKLDGDSRFEIETPTAIMGVMGTDFTVKYENEESYVGVFEGAVKTKYGEGLQDETTVTPNEQLQLNEEGTGGKEKLDYRDLPLVGLEHYVQLLEKDPEADKNLINQVKQVIETKTEVEAAEVSTNSGSSQSSSGIVYEDKEGQSSDGGNSVTPTPTATPTVTPIPTVSPTATPTAIPNPPELDVTAFYGNLSSYIINDKNFVLPFTATLAYNGANSAFPADGSQVVKFEVYQENAGAFIENKSMVETVKRDLHHSNRLVVTLSQAVPYGSKIRITIREGKLKNAETNDIQIEDQVTASERSGQGFTFKFDQETIPLEFIHEADAADSYQNLSFSTLGYHIPLVPEMDNSPDITISKVCPGDGNEGEETQEGGEVDSECYPNVIHNGNGILLLSMIENRAEVSLNTSYFKRLEPALYQVRLNFKDDNGLEIDGHVDIHINVRQFNPPVALSYQAQMTDDHTLILPFSTSLMLPFISSNLEDLITVSVYNIRTEVPVLTTDPFNGENEDGDTAYPPFNAVNILNVVIDGNDRARLIVTLEDAVEYGSLVYVNVNPNLLLNADTKDMQEAPQFFNYMYRSELSKNTVRFIHKSPVSDDVEIMINSRGNEIGNITLLQACDWVDNSCSGYESPPDLDKGYELTRVGHLAKLTLKGAYFSNEAAVLTPYWLIIPIIKDEEQIDVLYIEIMVYSQLQ
ncbi:FecR family protein [Paenibacillus sp. Soil522]|uniref:FecR family protein n=1 Tax=Paenibacillus sp. Soil522 TaxID=1736388 RepID=UPI0007005A24|nr:FecR family protein [Paenibacillus sp. Soil522]KRE47837.1 hypothetical protein ASG81_07925 [Paenibacillus sp. Soil522]